jgi:hypothetical protein
MSELDWKSRHPFSVGQTVYARAQHELGSFGLFLGPGKAYSVRMGGEDAHGSWIAVVGVVERLPAHLFTIEPPPATVTDLAFAEVAEAFPQSHVIAGVA